MTALRTIGWVPGRAAAAVVAVAIPVLLVALLGACAPQSGVVTDGVLHLRAQSEGGVQVLRIPATGVGRPVTVRRSLFSSFTIPRGHVPPPGTCRIWYHDRAPSRQPPMGACSELERTVPAGAYLVYG
jgi:hypothetical protein